jgi:hypothetical protein
MHRLAVLVLLLFSGHAAATGTTRAGWCCRWKPPPPATGWLVVTWGDGDTERGRTTYRLEGDGIAITDEVVGKDGAWKVFGETTASRSAP